MALPESLPQPRIPSGVGSGWWPLIEQLHQDILTIDPDYQLDQAKEKLGLLRFYASSNKWSEISPLISAAEGKSASICERCGAEGKLRTDEWWVKTLCDNHHAERTAAKAAGERWLADDTE